MRVRSAFVVIWSGLVGLGERDWCSQWVACTDLCDMSLGVVGRSVLGSQQPGGPAAAVEPAGRRQAGAATAKQGPRSKVQGTKVQGPRYRGPSFGSLEKKQKIKGQKAVIVFLDLVAAFDSCSHKCIDAALAEAKASNKTRAIFRAMYAKATGVVRVRNTDGAGVNASTANKSDDDDGSSGHKCCPGGPHGRCYQRSHAGGADGSPADAAAWAAPRDDAARPAQRPRAERRRILHA
eukprot:COSAG01_NODE_2890_length_6906_cov_23.470545_1_plen_236_part_00